MRWASPSDRRVRRSARCDRRAWPGAIETVDARVEHAVGVPADVEVVGVEADVADLRGLGDPVDALRDAFQ
jgi:hypothetical protein